MFGKDWEVWISSSLGLVFLWGMGARRGFAMGHLSSLSLVLFPI